MAADVDEDDSICQQWIENMANETQRCEVVIPPKIMYCFGDLDYSKMDVR